MTSLGSLQAARTGLNAAQAGLQTTSQNITNASTVGYTRQRTDIASINPANKAAMFTTTPTSGQGAQVTGVTRIGDAFLDAQARSTAATSGAARIGADAYSAAEAVTGEPTSAGVSHLMQGFWSSWQDVGNDPGSTAPVSVLLENAGTLTEKLNSGMSDLETQWTHTRSALDVEVSQANTYARDLATLNHYRVLPPCACPRRRLRSTWPAWTPSRPGRAG